MGEQKRKHVAATIAKARLLGMVEIISPPDGGVYIEVTSTMRSRGQTIRGMRPFDTLYQAAIYHLTVEHGLTYEEIVKAAGGASRGPHYGLAKRRRKRKRFTSQPKSARVAQQRH